MRPTSPATARFSLDREYAAPSLPGKLFFDANRHPTPRSDYLSVKDVDLTPLNKAGSSFLQLIQPLFAEHAFLTIICAFFAVLMTLSCYRFLKSLSPGLVAFILMLIFGMLMLHWTFTRTEPAILKPVIDFVAPFFPSAPNYKEPKPTPAKKTPAYPAR